MTYRFYYPGLSFQDNHSILDKPDLVKQLTKVLRITKDAIIYLFDNSGMEYECKIVSVERSKIHIELLRKYPGDKESPIRIILYQALLKKDKWEWLLQKVAELGVYKIVPLITEFTIVDRMSGSKWERYNKILMEATEQCGGCKIPILEKPVSFKKTIQSIRHDDGKKFLLHPDPDAIPLSSYRRNENTIHLLIGPEGGFSPGEIVEAKSYGFTLAHLGKRILRAETAGICAVNILSQIE